MKPLQKRLLCLGALSLSSLLTAASFKDATKYIDDDGTLVAYVNFEGDGQEIGSQLNTIYQSMLAADTSVLPVPIDFTQLFDNLGFGCIEAIAMSSKELDNGFHANRSAVLLNGKPTGLMALYGASSAHLAPFTAAELAPEDASGAFSGYLDLTALQNTASAIMVQTMGPLGEGLLQAQLQQIIPATDIHYAELITLLSGSWDGFWQERYDENMIPSYKAWVRVQGAGTLLTRLEPLFADMAVIQTTEGDTTTVDFSPLLGGADFGLVAQSTADGALILYTHADWGPESDGPRLSESEHYQQLAKKLPANALNYIYSAGYDFSPLLELLKTQPEIDPYAPVIEQIIELAIGDFLKPNVTATSLDDDAMFSVQYGNYSTKQALMILPTVVFGGVSAAMAIPAFQKVRTTSQEETILNNLRQISAAAEQYMLENGVNKVSYEQLIGPDGYISPLDSVAGENYDDMIIRADRTGLSVELPDGRVIESPY